MQRREFLAGSALAGLAAAQSAGEKINTGLIGTGNRGAYLLKGVLEQPQARVVTLCDTKPDRLDKAATTAARDNPRTVSDWRRVIDSREIQAVVIATPPYLHAEMAIAALQSGKHVYCEKPIGITVRQVKSLLREARASKKIFQAGQQLRSMKMYQEAIARIRAGALGDVVWVKAQRHGTADLPHEGSSADWYFDDSKSGGYLVEMSVHNLDLVNWAVGTHPVKVIGQGSTVLYRNDPPGRTIYDSGSLTYEYPNGVLMSFTQNVFHPRGLPGGGQYVYVYGSKGALDMMGSGNFYPRDASGQPEPLAQRQKEDEHAHMEAFYSAIERGTPSPAPIEVGVAAALTAIMGHDAMTSNKAVHWKDLGVEI